MSLWTPYSGSLKAPTTFTKDYDEGRRYEFRSFGHILLFLSGLGLSTGYANTALVIALISGLITLLRGYIPARSSEEWHASEDINDQSPSMAVRAFAFTVPLVGILLIIAFGISLAGFLMDTRLFMVGLVGMVSTAAAFFLLLRKN